MKQKSLAVGGGHLRAPEDYWIYRATNVFVAPKLNEYNTMMKQLAT
jgi:hypothetical protein